MKGVFYIVGPTATGKSELAADIAVRLEAEIVNADAFQVYVGFDVLSGKPDSSILQKIRHHLIGTVPVNEEMSAARYRDWVLALLPDISFRGKRALIVGGSGLYLKALTDGLVDTPPVDAQLREELNGLSTDQLRFRLGKLDPAGAEQVDMNNRRRLVRAIEICLMSGRPSSEQRTQWKSRSGDFSIAGQAVNRASGVFVFRERDDLYERINQRVEMMLGKNAIDEVRNAGPVSRTVVQMIGIKEIQQHLRNEISLAECTSRIQQVTRRYAKRQLTWFRRQSTFEPLNLSLLSHNEAVEWVTRRAIAAAHGE